ncbi:reverse transcriptase domain-containing protein [Tanacetum coccineum]|uniref:Reverse transcriptase domain-containing protein n=1 Tax=Tanacetum coccineum TaxID=301880 RepID=A0ABQ5D075_9ASTR
MRTRSQSRNSNRQQQQVNLTFVEPFNLVEPIENHAPPVVTIDDTRTMAQLLEAPTVGYEDAIIVPEITADFELKHESLESKSKVRNSRNKPVVAKVSASSSTPGISPDVAELKDMVKSLLLYKKSQAPAPVKEVEESCVTCVLRCLIKTVNSVIPSRQLMIEGVREKANGTKLRRIFMKFFKDLSFEISLTDALILMPKFASTLKALIGNKEKLSEMARTPLNEHCSAVILNKLPKKLGDPGKFLIPCDFPGMDECLALADLGASINLMPLSVWKKLSLPELTLTCMDLDLQDRSESHPNRSTGRALIDVYEGELTLRVRKEAVTFNLDQTSRYSSNYDDMKAN